MAWSQCSMYRQPGGEGVAHSNDTVTCHNGWTYVWDTAGETSIVSDVSNYIQGITGEDGVLT